MTRSTADIIARIKVLEEDPTDFFGFQANDLVCYLPFEAAKPWLNENATPEVWTPNVNTPEAIKQVILDYMEFAWDKANNRRGLSAGRSLDHMKAWLWMLDEDAAWVAALKLSDYTHYGKPQLRAICKRFGWDWTAWDDGAWGNSEHREIDVRPEDVPEVGIVEPA
ncbi:hypothetical protein CcrSwift_gp244 [Caulobacter phage CcrSwift]|uniref:Uncharacterized protein n=1 Tax=Caulobacter phage CcrSwift TaxID=2927984 RepID=K4K7E3_9CAUD|nr:hypothetical protein CcrMagneto_gp244 [Caulobacter virus Magneto]YP_006989977.1 hypothetical protein D870_gp177 [Caulobacter phage CcrSwift]AFU87414.1 hypothetical protein CcrMagneto_gp244 [Caulobacter virus Magneto]AFU88562.1 hypothetical protein CcrSwift_gp244 [Caulobacter phage CcrSwift]